MATNTLPWALLVLTFLCCHGRISGQQPPRYPVNMTQVTLTGGAHNKSFPILIYYPVVNATHPEGSANTSFPLIVFTHCLFGADVWYDYLVQALVPTGYIFASNGAYDYFVSNPEDMATDSLLMRDAVYNMSRDPKSFLFKMVSSQVGLAGHSLGGMASLLMAEDPTNFTSVLTLSTCFEKDTRRIHIPAFLLTGTQDCICPPTINDSPVYGAIQSSCKILANLHNATHCGYVRLGLT